MVQVRQNYKQNNMNNVLCPCCHKEDDHQQHLISCETLTSANVTAGEYNSMFGNCDKTMSNMISKMEILVKQRTFIIESSK